MAENSKFAGERTIQEFWAGIGESNGVNQFLGSMPWPISGPIYFLLYVVRAANIFSTVRYTLTNRRIRVDRGMRRTTVNSVPLEEIEDVRLVNEIPFTRTSDLEILSGGKVVLTLAGIQDAEPKRRTILDAVRARTQVLKVLEQQKRAREKAAATS